MSCWLSYSTDCLIKYYFGLFDHWSGTLTASYIVKLFSRPPSFWGHFSTCEQPHPSKSTWLTIRSAMTVSIKNGRSSTSLVFTTLKNNNSIFILYFVYFVLPVNSCHQDITSPTCYPLDCKDVYDSKFTSNGVYWIFPNGHYSAPVQVYCDMTTRNGPWTVSYGSRPLVVWRSIVHLY